MGKGGGTLCVPPPFPYTKSMTKKQAKKLVLLDAHAIIHRAYHGMPDFTTRAGVPTGAIYGFASMVLRIIDDFKPDYVVACYDLPKPTFRHEAFDGYKGTRSETDEALRMQFPVTRELCEIFAIPVYDAEGFEADDVLGTIAEKLKNENIDIIIASGDMDTLQLVDKKRVQVFTLKRGNDTILYDEKAVVDRFGFSPKSIIDYKAFCGDSSDNIPGIRGIGDKAATRAISAFGTIEKTYEALEKDEQLLLDTGLTKRMLNLIKEGRDDAEFSKILARIRTDAPIDFVLPEKDWKDDINLASAEQLFEKYELRSLSRKLASTLGIDLDHAEKEEKQVPETISDDELALTAIALCLVDSDYAGADKTKILDYAQEKSFESASIKIFGELKNDTESFALYNNLEKKLYPLVQTMKKNGVLVDIDFFKKLSLEYHTELKKLEAQIFEQAGEEFNVKSPKQISHILFESLSLPTKGIKKSKTGSYSTNISVLEKLRDEHEIVPLIIDYRELQKLLSTYIDVIPDMVADDGRLHAEFLQYGTATGRFSSQNPNMQNIPTRSELGRKIREGFVADSACVLVSFDYSQIELRVLALLSQDESLMQIFRDGRDIHSAVAAQISGVLEDSVDREMRRKAKVVNFGILYGMGINALRKEMGTDKGEAQMFYNGFFENFPKAAAFLESSKEYAREHGYTKTLFGRKRQFKKINAKLPFIRAMAERMALNAPIQGTAADIIKLAMIHAQEKVLPDFPEAKLVLQIHDEIIYEIPKAKQTDFEKKMLLVMGNVLAESYFALDSEVPLLVHSSAGIHWGELK